MKDQGEAAMPTPTTLKQFADDLSFKVREAAALYLGQVEKIIMQSKELGEIPSIKKGAIVYSIVGEKIGTVDGVQFDTTANNNYSMPTAFRFNYRIYNAKGEIIICPADSAFTKIQIIELTEERLKMLKSKEKRQRTVSLTNVKFKSKKKGK